MENVRKSEISDLLRPYQWKGVHFLVRQNSCLLADEMGLGKTVQAAVALSLLIPKSKYGRVLIVVPAALRINWEKEIDKWAPKLSVRRLRGDTQERFANYNLPINVLIASYEQIRQDALSLSNMVRFDVVVLDEAQKIKNIHSETSLATRILQRDRSWAMTGTPIENSVNDLYAIFRFVKLGLLNQAMNKVEIHRLMKSYFMRRRKKNVLREMPPIILQDIPIELSLQQEKAYMNIWNNRYELIKKGRKRIVSTDIFSVITKLKQICNYDIESGESSKVEALKLIVDNLSGKEDKLIVFSQYVETLKKISEDLEGKITHEIYHGGLSEDARNMIITRFQEEEGPRVLLISLKAGGIGLNLQEASSIVLFDRWWNPAVEEQAIHRAHRFGRKNLLHVFRFTVVDSIEERIVHILDEKKALFEQYVNKAETAVIPSLDLNDLMKIINLQVD
ncbi:RNA polymerase-associated protein RapA [subsurface metagenome]|jgi:SNF2 family DNA or RNA helicase